jgi:aromatic ring-cleaving dioxygenase
MIQTADPITFSVPRTVLTDIVQLSAELTDRMHELLERNTNGELGPTEKAELETLVRMAEFGQIVSVALQP